MSNADFNTALQNLAQNQRTLSAQVAQLVTQQNIGALTTAVNNQFSNINSTLAAFRTDIDTLFSYINEFPNARFIDSEIPGGAINGTNPTFTLANAPIVGSLKVYVGATSTAYGNLALQSIHYLVVNNQITFQPGFIPATGSWIRAYYRY
jgi:hypothetical protein